MEIPPHPKSSGILKTFFIVIALILFGILIGVLAARFLPMYDNSALPTPTPSITPIPTVEITPLLTPTPSMDETVNWKTYTNSSLGFQIKYPNILKLSETDSPGETGYSYDIHLTEGQNTLLNFGGISKNYSEGRGGVFTDTQGYIENKGNYYCKSINAENLINKSKVTKITNPNGVEMLVIIGGNTEPNPAGETSCAEPGTGNIGVLINLKENGRYSGMGILYRKEGASNTLTEKDFNQILSTFKFTEPTATIKRVCPTTEWVDCMPSPDMIKPLCDTAFLTWAKANCPGFKGAAL